MQVEAIDLADAILKFRQMMAYQPYRLGGKWFVCRTDNGQWTAYRTKKAAAKHALDSVWSLDFSA